MGADKYDLNLNLLDDSKLWINLLKRELEVVLNKISSKTKNDRYNIRVDIDIFKIVIFQELLLLMSI